MRWFRNVITWARFYKKLYKSNARVEKFPWLITAVLLEKVDFAAMLLS